MALKQYSPAIFLALSVTAFLLACGGDEASTSAPANTPQTAATLASTATTVAETEAASTVPQWKYVNSGWVSPAPDFQVGPLEEEFRAFVITSQKELDDFQEKANIRDSRGTTTSLGRVDFPKSVLLAAYLMWRPVQGDPLSVVGFDFQPGQDGAQGRAEVRLELEGSPQGRERPFLLAPMTMVAVDRSIFPKGEPIDFVFQLDGDAMAPLSYTFNATIE